MLVSDVISLMDKRSPFSFACDWDNVGLLAGSKDWEVSRILVALDCTDDIIDQAIEEKADLIVTHHPMIFSPLKRITDDDFIGCRILRLLTNRIAYVAMHTNYDSFVMADIAADIMGIRESEVLDGIELPCDIVGAYGPKGIGRIGVLDEPVTLEAYALRIREAFSLSHVRYFGEGDSLIRRVAVCPGSGKSEIANAIAGRADVLVTGDIDHHSGIDAVAQGLLIIDAGHYGLEHIFVDDESSYLTKAIGNKVDIIKGNICEPMKLVV